MRLLNDEYILELNDVIKNSEIEELDLKNIFGERYKFDLARLSKKTYQVMYSAYRGTRRLRQQKALRYMIKNNEDYKRIMLEAQIDYVRGALLNGMDLRVYENDGNGNVMHPKSVVDILRSGGLWILGEIEYVDSDIDE